MNQARTVAVTKLAWREVPLVFLVTLCVASCTGTRPSASTNPTVLSVGVNNVFISQSINSHSSGDGTGSLIAKGKNNIITYRISDSDIQSYNTKIITIIEGDNNNITSTVRKCVLLYKNRVDTVIIKGNQLKIDFKADNIKQLVFGPSQKMVDNGLRQVAKESTGNSRNIIATKLNDPYSKGIIAADTADRTFDWSTTENATKLTGDEKVYVTALNTNLPLLAAVAYYIKQAQNGNYEACYQLGLLYDYDSQNFNVLTDLSRAIRYYELAARHNHATAAFRLGQIYELGDFEFSQVTINRAKAKYYYSLAAQNGNLDAVDKLDGWQK